MFAHTPTFVLNLSPLLVLSSEKKLQHANHSLHGNSHTEFLRSIYKCQYICILFFITMLTAVPPQLPQQEVVVQTALIYNGGQLIENFMSNH